MTAGMYPEAISGSGGGGGGGDGAGSGAGGERGSLGAGTGINSPSSSGTLAGVGGGGGEGLGPGSVPSSGSGEAGTYFPPMIQNRPLYGPAFPVSHHHHHQLHQHHPPPGYPPHDIQPPQAYQRAPYAHEVLHTPQSLHSAPRGPTTPHFKRSYQACMPCRSRKVKCDLGNPDAPNAPPCARCRREGKECVFSGPRASTKRKQELAAESGSQAGNEGAGAGRSRSSSEGEEDERSASPGGTPGTGVKRKRGNNTYPIRRWDEQTATYRRVDLIGTGAPQEAQQYQLSEWIGEDHAWDRRGSGRGDGSDATRGYVYTPRFAGRGRRPSVYNTRRRGGSMDVGDDIEGIRNDRDEQEEEGEEDILVTTKMHSTHDAMNLLFQAAERVSRLSPARDGPSEGEEDGDGASGSDVGHEQEIGQEEGPSREGEHEQQHEGGAVDVAGGPGSGGHASRDDISPDTRIRHHPYTEMRAQSTSPQLHRKRKTSLTHSHPTRRRTSHQNPLGNHEHPSKHRTSASFGSSWTAQPSGPMPAPLNLPPATATPWLFEVQPALSPSPAEESLSRALKVWQTFKFCKLKWITPFEAFTYVNYFHTHLLPLSPILSGHFALPSAQHDLLTNEPLLAMTILTIAARYCPLGAASRGVYLHGRFWQFTQGLVGRVIWGQDRGTGKMRGKETKGLRGLGTVEALLLWTEWHPRGIHFPPIEVGGEEELMGGMGMGMGLSGSGEGPKRGRGWDVSLVVPRDKSSDEEGDSDADDGEKEVKSWFSEYTAVHSTSSADFIV